MRGTKKPCILCVKSLLVITFILLGCKYQKNTDRKVENKEVERENQNLVISMEDAPSTLYPPLAISAYSYRVVELIHRGLFEIDETLSPKPDLAKRFSVKMDSKETIEIEIEIEKSKTCSGKEIDARMVKDSIDEYRSYGRLPRIKSIEVIDKRKIRIKSELYSSIFYDLSVPIFPKEATDCTGYFNVVKFEPSRYVVLESRDRKLRVLIKGVKNDITRILELEKGDADIVVNAIPANLLEYAISLSNVEVIKRPGVNITYIAMNTKNDYLKRKEIRWAIAYAIDREKILSILVEDMGTVINSMLPATSEFYCDCAKIEYSPQKAEEILDSLGIKKGEDGIRFSLVWKTSTVKYAIRNVKAIASYLEKVGIKVRIVPREFSTFFSDIKNGNFDIYTLNFVGVIDPEILRYIAHSSLIPPYGANRVFFSNPKFDKIIELASKIMNEKERRKELYIQAQKILMDELPYIPLWQVDDVIAYRKDKVKGDIFSKVKPGGSLLFLINLISHSI